MIYPMLASLADAPLDDPHLVYEPKYDGIRAIAEVPGASDRQARVRLWSRLGNEKTDQFPEIAAALERWGRRQKAAVVLDGEIVALDAKGDPTGFQQLQGRIHLTEGHNGPLHSVAYIAFDLLREDRTDLRDKPFAVRRAALERVFGHTRSAILRISEISHGSGRALYDRALASGWEGLIAKHVESRYKSGKRTPDWRKLKIVHEQEFVIGGWTEPRQTRAYFGALLLGVYEDEPDRGSRKGESASPAGSLVYVGHTGTGFNERELARLMKLLQPLEIHESPFSVRPHTNERPHWTTPRLVAQIKFTEWTADGKLRHPVYLGLRDDKNPREVRREPAVRLHATSSSRLAAPAEAPERPGVGAASMADARTARVQKPNPARRKDAPAAASEVQAVDDQLREIEKSRRDGVLDLPGGDRLAVTNLHKMFWPRLKLTKGDLFRYYARISPYILPAMADRPLVMKRYPNGVAAPSFYQHRAEKPPEGVRVEQVEVVQRRPQIIGGNLTTLLYTTQLAAISQDPWFSRVQTPMSADYAALDLDPMPDVPFARVLDVARWIRDELQLLGATGVPKTSGADGMHIYIPMPPETPYEAGLLLCQIVATVVAQKHSKHATIDRAVRNRGKRVYVDYLQNILGKTLATAYSARASEYAGVSAPLSWDEVDSGVRREDFTIQSMPARLRQVGDLWATLRKARGANLSRVARYAGREGRSRVQGDNGKRAKK
jgi:bifunctional non-homologous end joining protein LigD